MRQAIVTKYIGPTNSRGARVKATAQAGSVTVPWDYSLSVDDNHARTALRLADKFGWRGRWIAGALPDGTSNCYTMSQPTNGEEGVDAIVSHPVVAGE